MAAVQEGAEWWSISKEQEEEVEGSVASALQR